MLVVVDGDAWLHLDVVESVASAPIDLIACGTARAGLNACCAFEPDCVVTAGALPDHDAAWLIAAIRGQLTEVSATPIVAVTAQDEGDVERARLLRAGADVALRKPLSAAEIVAQAEALIAMTARVRTRRSALPSRDGPAVLAADLERVPIASVLAALEIERRSGEIWLTKRGLAGSRLLLTVASGALSGGWLDAKPLAPLEAMREALAWDGRRCEFSPGPDHERPSGTPSIGALLLEALRPIEPSTWRDLPAEGLLPTATSKLPPPPPVPRSRPPRATMPSAALSTAPGRRLVESVRPSARPDPRAEAEPPASHARRQG